MAHCAVLERRYTFTGIEGSNPSLSAFARHSGLRRTQSVRRARRRDVKICITSTFYIVQMDNFILDVQAILKRGLKGITKVTSQQQRIGYQLI